MDLASLMQGAQAAGIMPQGGGGGMPPQGGGAMPQGMPMGMPMGGGGNGLPTPGGGGGGDMAGQLMQIAEMIMSSPQGQQMVQALLTQMTPQAQMGPGDGGGPQGGMSPQGMPQGGPPMPPGAPQGGGMPPMSTEQELAMAQQMMGKKGPNDSDEDDVGPNAKENKDNDPTTRPIPKR